VADRVDKPLTESELDALDRLVASASPSPWVAYVEGRDHTGGDHVILVGDPREEDMYVRRETTVASPADLDFMLQRAATCHGFWPSFGGSGGPVKAGI
jgi:hypothetical protein